jgi:hypothetical protein
MLWIIIGAVYLLGIAWFAWEIAKAPLIDDENEEG